MRCGPVGGPARTAQAGQFHAAVLKRKAVAFAEIIRRPVYAVVFGLDHGAAFAADQELPGVRTVGMVARDERPLLSSRCTNPISTRNSRLR